MLDNLGENEGNSQGGVLSNNNNADNEEGETVTSTTKLIVTSSSAAVPHNVLEHIAVRCHAVLGQGGFPEDEFEAALGLGELAELNNYSAITNEADAPYDVSFPLCFVQ